MMEPGVLQGLLLGLLVGVFVGVFLWLYTGVIGCLLLIPFTGLMGAAPQFLKPKDDDNRRR